MIATARQKNVYLQMGYMFRYHHSFRQISDWAKSGQYTAGTRASLLTAATPGPCGAP